MRWASIAAFLILASALVAKTANAGPVSFDFASVSGSSIQFTGTGDTIDFPDDPITGYDFVITDSSSPSLNNLKGNIGGTFNVGTISGPTNAEYATITTSNGTLSVFDGSTTLTANLDWKDIQVYNSLAGVMNGSGLINLGLSSISYTGSNTGLLDILNAADRSVVLTFQFSPLKKKSLTDLMTDTKVTVTSFSGSVSAVPEPSACLMLGGTAVGLLLFVRRRK